MAQDMSSQGNSGLSKPGFGAKAPVQENGGFGVTQPAGTHNLDAKLSPNTGSAFAAQDKSTQGPAGTTDKMVHSVEATRAFGAGN
jgi:hypothetical protein